MFDEQLLRVFGEANLNLYGLVQADGVFDFRLSESEGLTVFADVSVDIGPESFRFSSHATGLLVIGMRNGQFGIATRLELSTSDLGDLAQLDVHFQFTMNTFEQDIVYDVPESFKDNLDDDGNILTAPPQFENWQYTIGATPTGKPTWTGMYIQLTGEGSLSLLDDALWLQGEFGIVVSNPAWK